LKYRVMFPVFGSWYNFCIAWCSLFRFSLIRRYVVIWSCVVEIVTHT
jgi:hypothetical protein